MTRSKIGTDGPKRGVVKILVWILIVLLVLVVAAYFVVSSSAFIKSVILPRVTQALDADLAVADVDLSPLSSLTLRDVKFTPKGAEPLFTAGLVRVRYRLFDFLSGKITVDEVTIQSPIVTLVENADGSSNLDPLMTKLKSAPKPSEPKPARESAPPQISVASVTLKNATLRRTKHFKGGGREVVELTSLEFSARQIKNGGTGKFDLSAVVGLENATTNRPGTLQAKFNGNFSVALSADLKPAMINGQAGFTVSKSGGSFAELNALAAALTCEATPTEVKQMLLRFTQSGQPLGEIRASGPFDPAKSEGRLNIAMLSLDRRVLNLAGAASGIDFGTTTVNATNVVELAQGGSVVTAAGQFDVARMQIIRQGQATPTTDLLCNYSVAVNLAGQSAVLQKLNLTGTQNQRPLLQAELTSPMTIAWGNTSTAGDAALNLTVTDLNLADWRAFAADLAPSGSVNLKAKMLSQQGGKQLTFDLGGDVRNLSAKLGTQTISGADVRLSVRGTGTDLKQFKLEEFRLDLAQQGQSAVNVSGNGIFDSATQDADLQIAVQAAITRVLAMFPQPDARLSSGTVELKGRVTKKQSTQSVTGQLVLANLTGSYANSRFADFGSTMDLDLTTKDNQLEIRKASGELHEGAKPGGKFDVSGNLNLATKAGQLALKLDNFNQDGLRPFLESALGDKKLVSVAVRSTASATFAANGDATVKGDIQLANLVVSDPKGSLSATPLEAKAQVDAGVAKSVAQIRQCQLTLTPTDRAKNELGLTGTVDFSKTNAITGNLKLAADSLDVTRFYDLFGSKPKPGETTTTTTTTASTAPPENKEPDAVKLPFRNFTFEAAIGRFYLREIDAQNVQLTLKLDGSHVLLRPAQLTLNGAPVSMTADLDLSVPGYRYDVTFSANRIPIEPLANSFSPAYRGQANGVLIASANLKGAGVTGVNLKRSLTGNVDLSFTNANIQIVGPKAKKIISPIALVLGAPELLNSPLNYVNASIRAGNGNIEIPAFIAHTDAFIGQSQGVIPIADVLTNSPLNQNIEVSLSRQLANKLRFTDVPTNVAYMKLPTFVYLKGTLGNPEAKTDKTKIIALTAAGIGGAVGGKAGGILEGVGVLFGGKPAPAASPNQTTNTPPSNVQQPNPVNDILNLFKKPKK